MPRPKKKNKVRVKRAKPKEKPIVVDLEKEKIEHDYQNNLKCIKLINYIRKNKDEESTNKAFDELLELSLIHI